MYLKNWIHIYLTLQRIMENSLLYEQRIFIQYTLICVYDYVSKCNAIIQTGSVPPIYSKVLFGEQPPPGMNHDTVYGIYSSFLLLDCVLPFTESSFWFSGLSPKLEMLYYINYYCSFSFSFYPSISWMYCSFYLILQLFTPKPSLYVEAIE